MTFFSTAIDRRAVVHCQHIVLVNCTNKWQHDLFQNCKQQEVFSDVEYYCDDYVTVGVVKPIQPHMNEPKIELSSILM